jgi:hypothetical protein
MGIKMMIYRMCLKDVGMSSQGKVMSIEIPVVDCPKPSLGKGAALQNCMECDSCQELNPLFVDCSFQSKQQVDQARRAAAHPTQTPKAVPPGVFDPKPQQ